MSACEIEDVNEKSNENEFSDEKKEKILLDEHSKLKSDYGLPTLSCVAPLDCSMACKSSSFCSSSASSPKCSTFEISILSECVNEDDIMREIQLELLKLDEEKEKTEKDLSACTADCNAACSQIFSSLNKVSNSFANLKEESYATEKKLKNAFDEIKYVYQDLSRYCIAKKNIQTMLSFVGDVIKLEEIYENLNASMQQKNIEDSVKYIAEFHGIYNKLKAEDVFNVYDEGKESYSQNSNSSCSDSFCNFLSGFAPQPFCAYNLLTPKDKEKIKIIQENEAKIKELVKQEFDLAILKNKKDNVFKYAKLFYPLKMRKEGIATYVCFLINLLSDKCAKNFRRLNELNVKDEEEKRKSRFVEVLTDVFDFVSDLLQTYQQNIEEEFGIESLIIFLRGFQEEVDVQAIRIINKFIKDRSAVFDCSFEESFPTLPVIDESLEELTQMIESSQNFEKYLRNLGKFVLIEKFKKKKEKFNEKEKMKKVKEEKEEVSGDEDINNYELSMQYSEISSMNKNYKIVNLNQKEEEDNEEEDFKENHLYTKEDGLLLLSALTRKIQELTDKYVAIEYHFMLFSVNKALKETDEIALEEFEGDTSTLVDDSFFIFKKSFLRAISACDIYAICAVINNISNILSEQVKQTLEENLSVSKKYYANYLQDENNVKHFILKNSLPDIAIKLLQNDCVLNSSYSWLHSVNNVNACVEYIHDFKLLCSAEFDYNFLSEEEKNQDFIRENNQKNSTNRDMFHHTLQNIENVKAEFEALHKTSCNTTLNILKVHLVSAMQILESTNFNISEEEYADYQVNDPFMKNLISSLKVVIEHIKKYLQQNTFSLIIFLLVEKVCKRIESIVINKCFSLLGGVQLDSDIRNLLKFFTQASDTSIRSKFFRLIEIGDLLSFGSISEFEDFWATASQKKWHLNLTEIHQILSLRSDFSKEILQNFFQGKN